MVIDTTGVYLTESSLFKFYSYKDNSFNMQCLDSKESYYELGSLYRFSRDGTSLEGKSSIIEKFYGSLNLGNSNDNILIDHFITQEALNIAICIDWDLYPNSSYACVSLEKIVFFDEYDNMLNYCNSLLPSCYVRVLNPYFDK